MCKKNKMVIALLCCFAVMLSGSVAGAQSLWAEGSSRSLFADRKAQAVGDSLTIIINESSNASRSKNSNNSKSGSNTLEAGTGIFDFLASASASGSDSFKASGSINDSNTVSGRITVQVVEVKPNGNLLIAGTQMIRQNKDEHKITITGIVRSDDIKSDNTILSYQVSDAQMKFDGKGPLNAKQRQGILTQIFNLVF